MPRTILVAGEAPGERSFLFAALASARYRILTASDAEETVRLARHGQIDLILANEVLALGGSPVLLRRLRRDPETRSIPIIVLSESAGELSRVPALRKGADDVMSRHAAPELFLARIRSLLRAASTAAAARGRQRAVDAMGLAEPGTGFQRRGRIAFVSHDLAEAEEWKRSLPDRFPHDVSLHRIAEIPDVIAPDKPPDLFVLDAPMAHPGEALGLISELRTVTEVRHAAHIVVHHPSDTETATMALELGANDLIEAGADAEELAIRIEIQVRRKLDGDRLRASVDRGLKLAIEDGLTGLCNRRHVEAYVKRLESEGKIAQDYCVIVADIDRFKAINDGFGHAAGDRVLVQIARLLKENVRGMDLVARYGGEEFLLFLPEPDLDAASAAAERLRVMIRETPFLPAEGERPIEVTVSFGVAQKEKGEGFDGVVRRADGALYEAKWGGRDAVRRADTAGMPGVIPERQAMAE